MDQRLLRPSALQPSSGQSSAGDQMSLASAKWSELGASDETPVRDLGDADWLLDAGDDLAVR
ncbi:MAG TPA: hypothetical protein VLC09_16055 [Polyangiaceae bacterium]|nr:hypothetical protein [Polyangiaceae bacterium]